MGGIQEMVELTWRHDRLHLRELRRIIRFQEFQIMSRILMRKLERLAKMSSLITIGEINPTIIAIILTGGD